MKYAILGLMLAVSGGIRAQQNVFLDQSYWQSATIEKIKADIAKGNSPSAYNAGNFDPVVMAINGGASNEAVKFLLSQDGNDVNKLTHDGRTYIFWAASKGNTELMEFLVLKGAKLKMEDNHGYTPLNFAANGGQKNTQVYDICLKAGADLQKDLTHDGANALLLAIPSDADGTLTEYFVSKGLSLKSTDANGSTAFDYTARTGNIEGMKALRTKGVPFTNNAMLLAAQGGRRGGNKLEVFQYLESIGIPATVVGKNGDNVLHSLVRRPGQEETIKYFLSKGVKVDQANKEGNTVFMNAAASTRDLATLELLRAQVKDINKANAEGATALTMAVRGNSPEVVQYLIEKGANVNVVNKKGENLTAFLFDAYNPRNAKDFEGKLDVLKKAGLDIAKPLENGNTLYHLATAKNDVALLKMVAAYNVDVNAKNKEGYTALHKAAMLAKDDAVLKYLLSIGAKKDVKTGFDETAFDLAGENENFARQNLSIDFLK